MKNKIFLLGVLATCISYPTMALAGSSSKMQDKCRYDCSTENLNKRQLKLVAETNSPSGIAFYPISPSTQSSPATFYKEEMIELLNGKFNGVIDIPSDYEVVITVAKYNSIEEKLSGAIKIKDEPSAVINLKVTSLIPEFKNDFNKLTLNQKKHLLQVLSQYNIALNSPKMLFASKVAEAEGNLDLFYLDAQPTFKSTSLSKYLVDIKTGFATEFLRDSTRDSIKKLNFIRNKVIN